MVWNTIVPLGWTIGWDTVAWVRVSPLAGLLQPGLAYTLAWWDNVAWVIEPPISSVVGWDTVAWVSVDSLQGSYASVKCQGILIFSRSGNCQGISLCVREK